MYTENDYIMRLIHELVHVIMMILAGKGFDKNMDFAMEMQCNQLTAMIEQGDINCAENILMDQLDTQNMQQFQLALMFYHRLNKQSDSYLVRHNYSRQEIFDGIEYVVRSYGYGSIMEAFVEDK